MHAYLSAVVGFNGVVEGGEDLEDLSRRWNLHLKDSWSPKEKQDPCMLYFLTCTMNLNKMQVKTPYMDAMGNNDIVNLPLCLTHTHPPTLKSSLIIKA